MIKNVLISHNSIPTLTIGSWKRMMTDLIKKDDSLFEYIICPIENTDFLTSKHLNVNGYRESRLLNKFNKFYRFKNYTLALETIIKKEKQVVITIVDNYGILLAVHNHLLRIKKREDAKIIFLQRGYDYYLNPEKKQNFFNAIDLLIVLTISSYKKQLSNVHSINCRVKQLYNGVDSSLFKPVNKNERNTLRQSLGFNPEKKYFLWLSQDRKKKGLHIILKIWEKLIEQNEDIELLIIGTTKEYSINNVTTLGRIPNSELPKYYQISDFYLFPTLCHEGFGLSLAEALKSGAYCIVSNIEPMSEILANGAYGHLVDNPNFEESWFEAINIALKRYKNNDDVSPYLPNISKDLYDLEEWRKNITLTLKNEKQSIN